MVEFPFKEIVKIDLTKKKLLIPNMHPYGARLLSACLRGFEIDANVLPTYVNLELGKQFTSGKECFPCQVTISDILNYLLKEKNRLKDKFNPKDYVYLMPESDGPCRFGMYNKFQRLVLNSFKDFKDIYISYFTTEDSYSTKGVLPDEKATKFKKIGYFAMVLADVFDRIVWRVRPYEIKEGITEEIIDDKLKEIESIFEAEAQDLPFKKVFNVVESTAVEAKKLINPSIKRKPRIGIVGEIYLRTHSPSNQFVIKKLEKNGAEVVNASLCEWINFVTFENIRKTKLFLKLLYTEKLFKYIPATLKKLISLNLERQYQLILMKKTYGIVLKYLDIQKDHDVAELEKYLENNSIYSYEVGTEAALSIAGALCYIEEGFNGVVNVFPFSCMPSTITSAILKPIMRRKNFPYLDLSYDGTNQPNRDIAIKTFIFQAMQHRQIDFSWKIILIVLKLFLWKIQN